MIARVTITVLVTVNVALCIAGLHLTSLFAN